MWTASVLIIIATLAGLLTLWRDEVIAEKIVIESNETDEQKTNRLEKQLKNEKTRKLKLVSSFFIILTLIFTIWQIHLSNLSSIKANEEKLRQHITDSIQYVTDSLRFIITTQKLQEQRSIDSTKIKTDSNRFDITIKHFMNEALKQNKTLINLEEILHPFTPMTLELGFQVKLSNNDNSKLIKLIAQSIDKGDNSFPSFFKIDEDGGVHSALHSLKDTTNYSNDYMFLNTIISYFLPEPDIIFYRNQNVLSDYINNTNEAFYINGEFPIVINKRTFNPPNQYLIKYDYYPKFNELKSKIIIEPPTQISFGNLLKSLYDIKKGSIAVNFRQSKDIFSAGTNLELNYALLKCGGLSPEVYYAVFDEKDTLKFKSVKIYFKSIEDLITSRTVSRLHLLSIENNSNE